MNIKIGTTSEHARDVAKSSVVNTTQKDNSSNIRKTTKKDSAAILHISKEGMERSLQMEGLHEETVMDNLQKQSEELLKSYEEQLENSDKEADAMKDLAKIMETARRIANGDTVPAKDEKKLMEFSSELYQAAKAAAVVNANKEHKKYESLYEEDSKSDEMQNEIEDSAGEISNVENATDVENTVIAENTGNVEITGNV